MDDNKLLIYFANLNTLLHNVLNFHWNVSGGLFLTLHQLYENQYNHLFESIDQLAELLKGMDIYPLTELSDIMEKADIKTMKSKDYSARDTIEEEIKQFDFMNRLAKDLGNQAEKMGNLSLVDYFTLESNFYNKQLYFLRQFIK